MSQRDPDELDPATEEWLRGLLADSPGGEAPPDVRARLDDVLAGLREAPGPPVPLRRRWAPRLVAAAAAVVVIGGGGYLASQVTGSGGTDAESTTAADTATFATPGASGSAGQAPRTATDTPSPARKRSGDSATAGDSAPEQAQSLTRRLEDAPVISVDDTSGDVFVLAAQVAHGQRLSYFAEHAAPALNGTSPLSDAVTQGLFGEAYSTKGNTGTAPQVQDAGGTGCAGPSVTDSVSLRVRYDGGLAVVVLHAPPGTTSDSGSDSGGATPLSAELWTCDGSKRLVSTPIG